MKGTAEVLLLLMVLMLFAFHHWIFGLISLVAVAAYAYFEWKAYRRVYDPDWRWGGGSGPF